jgi:hypothetical protein
MMYTRVNDKPPTFTLQAIIGSFFIGMKLKAKVKLCTSIPYITFYQQLPYYKFHENYVSLVSFHLQSCICNVIPDYKTLSMVFMACVMKTVK